MAETLPVPPAGPATIEVGALIGDTYEVVRLIGKGGMGEVWAARHRRLPGMLVAIKVLHTGGRALTPEALARFRREAEVASRIGHPNIVQVQDFNTLPDGSPYLVLELLQGESLASKLRFGALAVDEAVSIARQTGSALKAAHELGIVHRDLKPDNVFLVATPMGTMVKVLDFGISKVRDSTTVQTQEAVLLGTPQYMSPEQALGNNKDVGPQSDVFALGAITYEMLAGAPPFQSESVAQVVFQIAYQPHVPLAQRRADLPPRVVQAVEKALLKDRAHRWADIGAFVAELSGKPLESSSGAALPPPVTGPSGVATPGLAGPAAFAPTAMSTPSPKPNMAAVVDDGQTSVSSSGKRALSYTSSSSKKWVAYVVAAGLLVGVAGTSLLASQRSGDRLTDAPAAVSAEAAPRAPAQKSLARSGAPSSLPPPPVPTAPPPGKEALARAPAGATGSSGPDTANSVDTPPELPSVSAREEPPPPPEKTARPSKPGHGATAAPAKAAPPAALPPPDEFAGNGEERALLVELTRQSKSDPKALINERRRFLAQLSDDGKEYVYALCVEASCDLKDGAGAKALFNNVHLPKLQRPVRDHCAPLIGAAFLAR